ncbi:MAG: YwaF family protein [Saccharofermentans sp.]|nr:YwaF family protein [Saccharofermentans sp.]
MDSFEHFCPEHIAVLIAITVMVTAGLISARKLSDKNAVLLIRILSVTVLSGEIIQDILLIRDGGDIIEFLPLHLCNLGIFVNLAASFTRGKIRSFFAEISAVLILPGSIAALLFPDWTYRPFWSYLPLLCFFTHALLVFIPLLFLVRKTASVSFTHIWYPYLFLLAVTPPIYLLDIKAGVNYMFLLYPTEDSPLTWISSITGEKLYLLGLAAILTVFLILEYAVCSLLSKGHKF